MTTVDDSFVTTKLSDYFRINGSLPYVIVLGVAVVKLTNVMRARPVGSWSEKGCRITQRFAHCTPGTVFVLRPRYRTHSCQRSLIKLLGCRLKEVA